MYSTGAIRAPSRLRLVPAPYDAHVTAQDTAAGAGPDAREAELLAQVAEGDAQAFAALYDAWSGRLFALVLQILVDRAQSEEVLQEVFLEVWQRAATFSPERGSVRAWLVTMTRRRAIDRVRASQAARDRDRAYRGSYEPNYDMTVQTVEDRLEGRRVRRALEAIGEPHRSTIELAYFSGLTHSQIAEHCGVPLGTVKTRIRDGISKLRAHLEVER